MRPRVTPSVEATGSTSWKNQLPMPAAARLDRVADRGLPLEERRRLPHEMVVEAIGLGRHVDPERDDAEHDADGQVAPTIPSAVRGARSSGCRPRGRPGHPVLRSDPPSTLVQEPFPGDWPRIRWVRARHGSAVSVDRDPGDRWRDPDRPRARPRPTNHSGISAPGFRVRWRPLVVPLLGLEPRRRGLQRVLRARLLPRLHAGLPLCPVAGRDRRQGPGRYRRPDQGPADHRGSSSRATSCGR